MQHSVLALVLQEHSYPLRQIHEPLDQSSCHQCLYFYDGDDDGASVELELLSLPLYLTIAKMG